MVPVKEEIGKFLNDPEIDITEHYFLNKLVSAYEIQQMDIPPIKWVVRGLLPEGMFILAGKPKTGKSFLALNISIAVASGGKALSHFDCNDSPVLYLALEDNYRRIQDRLKNLLKNSGSLNAPKNLFFYEIGEFPAINDGGMALLQDLINERPDIKLIILDTLGRSMKQTKSRRGNPFYEDYSFGAKIQDFALKHGICILIIHHLRKMPGENVYDEISGSTGLAAAPDGLLILKKSGNNGKLYMTGKDIEETILDLEFREGLWTYKGADNSMNLTPEKNLILEIFEGNSNQLFRPKEIATMLRKSGNNISKQLSNLRNEGLLESPKYGYYKLSGNK